jgi:hypothetical protein
MSFAYMRYGDQVAEEPQRVLEAGTTLTLPVSAAVYMEPSTRETPTGTADEMLVMALASPAKVVSVSVVASGVLDARYR